MFYPIWNSLNTNMRLSKISSRNVVLTRFPQFDTCSPQMVFDLHKNNRLICTMQARMRNDVPWYGNSSSFLFGDIRGYPRIQPARAAPPPPPLFLLHRHKKVIVQIMKKRIRASFPKTKTNNLHIGYMETLLTIKNNYNFLSPAYWFIFQK